MTTVLTHGCFDILHLGHIRHLQAARAMGERLVVSVTTDEYVNKGAGRPQFSAEQRKEQLLALSCVDEVVFSRSHNAVEVITDLKPAIYVKGPDYANKTDDSNLDAEISAVRALGGEFRTTTEAKWSSTDLLRAFRLSEEALVYVDGAKKRGFRDQILKGLELVDARRVVFVGEFIHDVYSYVRALGKPSKEFILATVLDRTDRFNGGIAAAAQHGEWRSWRIVSFFEGLTKLRYVDADSCKKLFEVYSTNINLHDSERENFRAELKYGRDDLTVVIDFGHGLIGNEEVDIIASKQHVAVTTQTNAGNYGYNLIGKYAAADYVCLDQPEARLATKMRNESVEDVAAEVARLTSSQRVTVTSGPHGALAYNNGECTRIPAFSSGGKDTMGAGDAFLAIAGPLVLAGLPTEVASFAGNVAGALKINIVGHSSHVTREDLVKNIDWLLK